jgi:hypothetical protein
MNVEVRNTLRARGLWRRPSLQKGGRAAALTLYQTRDHVRRYALHQPDCDGSVAKIPLLARMI